MARALPLAALVLAGCGTSEGDPRPGVDAGSDVAPESGCVAYVDRCCQPDPDAGWACNDVGDGVCYRSCAKDSDCTDPARSHCSKQCLCGNTDSYRSSRRVCRSKAEDDCAL